VHALLILTAATVLGIDVGWKNRPEGGIEYLIQIEPGTLDSLKAGVPIESDIPPQVKDVRSFRITSGKGSLPQESPRVSTPNAGSVAGAKPPTDPFAGARMTTPGLPPAPVSSGASPLGSAPLPPPPATASAPVPRPLGDSNAKPIGERQTAFFEPKSTPPATTPAAATTTEAANADAAEPSPSGSSLWIGLIASLVALAGSLTWNVYLLWMLREARRRYRALLRQSGISEDEVADMDLESEDDQDD